VGGGTDERAVVAASALATAGTAVELLGLVPSTAARGLLAAGHYADTPAVDRLSDALAQVVSAAPDTVVDEVAHAALVGAVTAVASIGRQGPMSTQTRINQHG